MDHKREDQTPPLASVKGVVDNNISLVVNGFRCKRYDGTIQ